MRIEFLQAWNITGPLHSLQATVQSVRITAVLLLTIVLSLLAVVYVKYQNHQLYNEMKQLEHNTYVVHRQYQGASSHYVKTLGFEAVETFVRKNTGHGSLKV